MKTMTLSAEKRIRNLIEKTEDLFIHLLVILLKPSVQYFYKKYRLYMSYSDKKKERILKTYLKKTITVGILLIFGIAVAWGSSLFTQNVNAEEGEILHKYYTSVMVEPGDSLWSIADEFYETGYESRMEYMNEVMHINHLKCSNEIISGTSLVVPYYTIEIK